MRIFKFELKAEASDDTNHVLIVKAEDENDGWDKISHMCAYEKEDYEVEEATDDVIYAHLSIYDADSM